MPAADEVAAVLQREMGIEVVVSPSLDSVEGFGLVNVISEETECNRLVLAIRAGAKARVFILDSDYGPVYVQGDRGLSDEALAAGLGPLRDLTAATSDFRMNKLDELARLEVFCPEGTYPLGGGMFNATPLADDGRASTRTPTSGSGCRADSTSPPFSSIRAPRRRAGGGECFR